MKTVTLRNGVADLKNEGWSRKVLFKEVIQGPFSIRIDVSEEMSDDETARFMKTLGESFAKLAQHDAAEMAVSSWAAGLIRVPVDYIGKVLSADDGNSPCSVGTGEIEVTVDERWEKGSSGKIRMPLGVERDVYQLLRTRRGGQMVSNRKKLLSAGAENGWAELSLQAYD